MKVLSTLIPAGLILAGLALGGCSAATDNTKTGGTQQSAGKATQTIALPAGWSLAAGTSATATLSAGDNNANALYADAAMVTDQAAQTNQTIWDYGLNTKTWVSDGAPARVPEAKALKFTIEAVGPTAVTGKIAGQDAWTFLDLKSLTYPSMTGKTGITFSIKFDKPTDTFTKCGLTVVVKGGGQEFSAPLNDAPNTNWDWLYWGDFQFINFKVPLSKLVAATGNTQTTIAAAVAAGIVFDEVVLKFRMDTGNTTPGEGGSVNTAYTAYLDNLALY